MLSVLLGVTISALMTFAMIAGGNFVFTRAFNTRPVGLWGAKQ